MNKTKRLKRRVNLVFIVGFIFFQLPFNYNKLSSQACLKVETILVDACAPPANPFWEGLNEMFRFRVGAQPINAAQMQISWANNIQTIPFNGFIQNAQTASVTAALNATVGSCGGVIIEPQGLILPANSSVIVITSPQLDVNANPFTFLPDTLYILYHNHAGVVFDPNFGTTVAYGHFINSNPNPNIPDIQTLSISVSSIVGCNVSVSYNDSFLVTQAGVPGAQDGASVNFNSAGNPTYFNNGCTAPVPIISPDWTPPLPLCSNAPGINLNNNVTGTPGGTWTGQGVSSNGQFNPQGLSGSIAITYNVGRGACAKQSTQNITVIPPSNPSWTIPSPLCASASPINLSTNVTGTPGGTWSGQGVSANGQFNPQGLSGSIAITYTVGAGTCTVVSTQNIIVIEAPIANWTPPQDFCESEEPIDMNQYITGNVGGTWSGSNISSAGLFNPGGLLGTITLTYSVGSGICESTSTKTFTIVAIPSADWNAPDSICQATVLSLNELITGTTGGTWSGNGVIGSTLNASGLTGETIVTYAVQNGSCIDSSTQTIGIIVLPVPLLPDDKSYCPGDSISSIIVSNGGEYIINWFSDQNLSSLVFEGNGFIPPAETKTYYVVFKQGVCVSPPANITITISSISATIEANTANAAIPFELVVFGQSQNAVSCQWFLNGEQITYTDGQVYLINDTGTYELKLSCINSDGCVATDVKIFDVIDDAVEIIIPNVFTPNNDGINDLFALELKGIKQLEGVLYNRWGRLIYEWTGLENFWDGTINGNKATDGVYFYVVKTIDIKDNNLDHKGTVTLIR
jgi:gliding motility-associated-like protein